MQTLAKQLKTICNETKYKMSEIHLLQNEGHNVFVTPMDIKNKLRTLLGGAEKKRKYWVRYLYNDKETKH